MIILSKVPTTQLIACRGYVKGESAFDDLYFSRSTCCRSPFCNGLMGGAIPQCISLNTLLHSAHIVSDQNLSPRMQHFANCLKLSWDHIKGFAMTFTASLHCATAIV